MPGAGIIVPRCIHGVSDGHRADAQPSVRGSDSKRSRLQGNAGFDPGRVVAQDRGGRPHRNWKS